MDLTDKKVLVFGTGRSGIGAARLLYEVGAEPILYDGNEKADPEKIRSGLGKAEGIRIDVGRFDDTILPELSLIVLSPGVPTDLPLVERFRKAAIPIWGELELAYELTSGEILAITGTNGKTTTTALVGKIMEDAGRKTFVVGNIGISWTGKALETRPDSVTVAEVSSFQLETIENFAPRVSAILNITPDHLDRHHTMEEYIRVKERITENQSSGDFCILNYEDEVLREFGRRAEPKVIWFSSLRQLPEGIFEKEGRILLAIAGETVDVMGTDELQILGRHNLENAMAAIAMTWAAGVPIEQIRESVKAFTAVEHRIEYVTEKRGVAYYNDSKGTNPDAAIKAVLAMNRPTIVIGGGYDKNSVYDEWIDSFAGRVRLLVLIGQTKEKIRDAALKRGFTDVILCEDLKEAVSVCALRAKSGEAVLLSPACASWGQFTDYEERGRFFKDCVRALPD